jgi:hypothetical protein
MSDPEEPVFFSVLRVESSQFTALHPGYAFEPGSTRILRSVLMKPEHMDAVEYLHDRIESSVRRAQTGTPAK